MTLGNDNGTDGQTDRVQRNMRPPPREEGRIIRQFVCKTHTKQAVSGRPPRYAPAPLLHPRGHRSALRCRTDGNVAVVSHGQHVLTPEASEAICKWGAQCRREAPTENLLMCPLTFLLCPHVHIGYGYDSRNGVNK